MNDFTVKKLFTIQEKQSSKKEFFIYLFLAYFIVLGVRLLLLREIDPQMPPLWAYDAGLYGFYAKQLLSGHIYPYVTEYIPGYLLFYAVKYTPFSLDQALLFLPPILASLSVLPIVFLGYFYNITKFSILVAIIGNLTYAYYGRSHIGYYDTDILNVTLATSMAISLSVALYTNQLRYFLLALLFSGAFYFWYHSSKAIIASIYAMFFIYYLFNARVLYKNNKKFAFAIIISLFVSTYYINYNDTYSRAQAYFDKSTNLTMKSAGESTLTFKNDLATVDEAVGLEFKRYSDFFSVNDFYLIVSLFTLLCFYFFYPTFLVTLPLIILALMSYKFGIRFSEYGVHILAFGVVYGVVIVKNILRLSIKIKAISTIIYVAMLGYTLYLYSSKIVTQNKFLTPVFNSNDISLFKKLDTQLKSNDFLITWWDYGWPLWYFTKANTIIDNGKHHHDNYIVSKLLFSSPSYSAKASKYFLQNCKNRACRISLNAFANKTVEEVDAHINALKEQKVAKNSYFVFFERMILTLPIMSSFSDFNLSGQNETKIRDVDVYRTLKYIPNTVYVTKHEKLKLAVPNGVYSLDGELVKVKEIYLVDDAKTTKVLTQHEESKNYVIVYKNKYVITCDKAMFDSLFVQMFLLKNVDKEMFQKIDSNQNIEVYKVL